jgi:hypothetical protein
MPEIAALPEGLLDDGSRQHLSAHLAGCTKCRDTAYRLAFFDNHPDDVPELVLDPDAWKRWLPPPPPKMKRSWIVIMAVAALIAAAASAAITVRLTEPTATPIGREAQSHAE